MEGLNSNIGRAISMDVEALGARFKPVGGEERAEVLKKLDIIADVICGSVVKHPAVPNRVGDGGEGD